LEKSIEEARRYAKMQGVEHLVKFIQADAEKLPFPDNEFDVTIAQAMLILVNNKEQVIREALRVLKPNGKSAWIELSWKKETDAEFRSNASEAVCGKCISNVVTFAEWQIIFKNNGYHNVEANQFNMNYRGFSKMINDEGIINGLKVIYKYLTNSGIRKRMLKLNNFFIKYPEFIGYGIYISNK
jgi:ubiquinone/menaquinone biosynthesis C-methylase UbiE